MDNTKSVDYGKLKSAQKSISEWEPLTPLNLDMKVDLVTEGGNFHEFDEQIRELLESHSPTKKAHIWEYLHKLTKGQRSDLKNNSSQTIPILNIFVVKTKYTSNGDSSISKLKQKVALKPGTMKAIREVKTTN